MYGYQSYVHDSATWLKYQRNQSTVAWVVLVAVIIGIVNPRRLYCALRLGFWRLGASRGMSRRPGNLSMIVKRHPPPWVRDQGMVGERLTRLRNSTLGVAKWIANTYKFLIFQTRNGDIWLQKKVEGHPLIMPFGGQAIAIDSRPLQPNDWFHGIYRLLHHECSKTFSNQLNWTVNVIALYEGLSPEVVYRDVLVKAPRPPLPLIAPKPVNAYIMFRC